MTEHEFRTQPKHKYQASEFAEHRDDVARGLLWEMGVGKSWVSVNECAYLAKAGKITGVLVVAPSGIHRNWIVEEFKAHFPEDQTAATNFCFYRSERADTKWHQKEIAANLKHDGLAVFAISYDAFITKAGKRAVWNFLKSRKCFYVVDEGRRIKNPNAARTKAVIRSGEFAAYRRLLNGTPVPNGPMDVYTQMRFLDPNFWVSLGISDFTAFKCFFGNYTEGVVRVPITPENPSGLRRFPVLESYRNLDVLQKHLTTICSRVTKKEALGDSLPDKIYQTQSFELNREQASLYTQVRDEFIGFLDSGEMVAAPMALTRLLRLQQITSGFVPVAINNPLMYLSEDFVQPILDIGKTNPRLELFESIAEDTPYQGIAWCRYRRTIAKVMDMLGDRAVRYDGTQNEEERAEALTAFKAGDKQWFISNAQVGGEGLTINQAKTTHYLENSFDLALRLQSEDRNHRIGQDVSVNVHDYIATGTVDEYIVSSLKEKIDISDQITGDSARLKKMLDLF